MPGALRRHHSDELVSHYKQLGSAACGHALEPSGGTCASKSGSTSQRQGCDAHRGRDLPGRRLPAERVGLPRHGGDHPDRPTPFLRAATFLSKTAVPPA